MRLTYGLLFGQRYLNHATSLKKKTKRANFNHPAISKINRIRGIYLERYDQKFRIRELAHNRARVEVALNR